MEQVGLRAHESRSVWDALPPRQKSQDKQNVDRLWRSNYFNSNNKYVNGSVYAAGRSQSARSQERLGCFALQTDIWRFKHM